MPVIISGCSSVIEYSRNLIWPRSIFFILRVWCWFSYGVLINSNNVWIRGIIQISKIFARLWQFSFLFYMCYNFLLMTRSLGCALTMSSFRNASKSYSLRGLSGVSKSMRSIPKWLLYFLGLEICFIPTLCLLSQSLRKVVAFERKVR